MGFPMTTRTKVTWVSLFIAFGGALMLSVGVPARVYAVPTCANTKCDGPEMCVYQSNNVCTLYAVSCTVKYC